MLGSIVDRRPTAEFSSCFGGGGFFAIAFGMGVADGMADVGIRLADHAMLGTSGGAWAAGALATGVPLDQVVATAASAKASGRPHPEIVRAVFGDLHDERVSTVVVDRRSGRRRIMRAAEVGVADAVGASSAAPGLFPAYEIGRRKYVDGGLYSPTTRALRASWS
jgi:predicted acylesterase/phospholipase RssA